MLGLNYPGFIIEGKTCPNSVDRTIYRFLSVKCLKNKVIVYCRCSVCLLIMLEKLVHER